MYVMTLVLDLRKFGPKFLLTLFFFSFLLSFILGTEVCYKSKTLELVNEKNLVLG